MTRRCGWCGVRLRWWQREHCRRCAPRFRDAGIYLQSGGPGYPYLSRWEAPPDPAPWVRLSH